MKLIPIDLRHKTLVPTTNTEEIQPSGKNYVEANNINDSEITQLMYGTVTTTPPPPAIAEPDTTDDRTNEAESSNTGYSLRTRKSITYSK